MKRYILYIVVLLALLAVPVEGNDIGRVNEQKKHEVIEKAPDNGAEIETIMNLASGMEQ